MRMGLSNRLTSGDASFESLANLRVPLMDLGWAEGYSVAVRWEYKVAKMIVPDENQLNKLGEQGWELVAVLPPLGSSSRTVHRVSQEAAVGGSHSRSGRSPSGTRS
jgi:hypothetical protein